MHPTPERDRTATDAPEATLPARHDGWLQAIELAWAGARSSDWSLERFLDRLDERPCEATLSPLGAFQ